MRGAETRSAGRWLRVALAVAAAALALLLPVANPGSGTAVNLHDVDAASIVRGDHHAKTLPSATALAVAVLVVAVAARRWRQLTAPPALTAVVAHARDGLLGAVPSTSVVVGTVAARRGPPAHV